MSVIDLETRATDPRGGPRRRGARRRACGADQPVLYVNPAFSRMTGYSAADLAGRNLRLLQGDDRDQDARQRMQPGDPKAGETCRVLIRNYRKDGSLFWNEIAIQPLKSADGRVTHFIGYSPANRASGRAIDPKATGSARRANARALPDLGRCAMIG